MHKAPLMDIWKEWKLWQYLFSFFMAFTNILLTETHILLHWWSNVTAKIKEIVRSGALSIQQKNPVWMSGNLQWKMEWNNIFCKRKGDNLAYHYFRKFHTRNFHPIWLSFWNFQNFWLNGLLFGIQQFSDFCQLFQNISSPFVAV